MTIAFYKEDDIKSAKEVLFRICSERPTNRKACASHPNPYVADVEDMLALFEKMEQKNFLFPKFVAEGYLSMPPQSGFIHLAEVMCLMKDEMAAFRQELVEIRSSNQKDMKSLEDLSCVKQDISDIKVLVRANAVRQKVADPMIPMTPKVQASVTEPKCADGKQSCSSKTVETPFRTALDKNSRQFESVNISKKSQSIAIVTTKEGTETTNARNHTKRRQNRNRNPNISGTRISNSGLSGAPRIFDLFVGGCEIGSTKEGIMDYCVENGVNVAKCDDLRNKSPWYKSYKLSMVESERDKLLVPEFWPQGIFVRKFYKPRQRQDSSVESSN